MQMQPRRSIRTILIMVLAASISLSSCGDGPKVPADLLSDPVHLGIALLPNADLVLFGVDCGPIGIEKIMIFDPYVVFEAPETRVPVKTQVFSLTHATNMAVSGNLESDANKPSHLAIGVNTSLEDALFYIEYEPRDTVIVYPSALGYPDGRTLEPDEFPCLHEMLDE